MARVSVAAWLIYMLFEYAATSKIVVASAFFGSPAAGPGRSVTTRDHGTRGKFLGSALVPRYRDRDRDAVRRQCCTIGQKWQFISLAFCTGSEPYTPRRPCQRI
jgi:hypothetical protein